MLWVAPSERDTATDTLEKRLWDAAGQFRANSRLKSQEYSAPVLGQAWPPEKILAKAREILEPMSQQIIVLKRQIQNLCRTRDLLLPRLLSVQVNLT